MLRKRLRKIGYRLKRWAARINIPRYKNVTLLNVYGFYAQSMSKVSIGARSAGISFRFLTAMFPLVIFLFSLIPFIPIDNLQVNLMTGIKNFFPPQIFGFFEGILTDLIQKKQTVLLSLGFLLSAVFAANAVEALIAGLNSSHLIQRKYRMWTQKLWSLGLLFIFFLLFIFSFILTSVGQLVIDYLYNHEFIQSSVSYWMLVGLKSTLTFITFMLSISLLYNVAHTDKVQWNFFNAGSFLSTVLILLLKETFGLYLTYFGKFDKVYGPIGAGLAFMVFIYYLFILLIVGFEVNTSLERAYYKKNYNFDIGSPAMYKYKQDLRDAKRRKKR